MIKINRVNSYRNIRVAKYIRLSREDGDDHESESIENTNKNEMEGEKVGDDN